MTVKTDVSGLVRNPEDRFPPVAAQLILIRYNKISRQAIHKRQEVSNNLENVNGKNDAGQLSTGILFLQRYTLF